VYKTKAISDHPKLEEHIPSQKALFCPVFVTKPDVIY